MDTPDSSHLAKFFLKKGFTLVEILIVIAIIGILALIVLLGLRGGTQVQKARDARRKGDLSKIARCLEEYNNDHGYFLPATSYSCGGSGLSPCIPKIPCDPYRQTQAYSYQTDGSTKPRWYKLYTNLEYTSDPAISSSSVGCSTGCAANGSVYNYYVGSSNAPPSTGITCQSPSAPICGSPQNYVGVCASCCQNNNSLVAQIDGFYYCCFDSQCGQ